MDVYRRPGSITKRINPNDSFLCVGTFEEGQLGNLAAMERTCGQLVGATDLMGTIVSCQC